MTLFSQLGKMGIVMRIGIIGFSKSGKTTLFNVLTKGNVEIGGYTFDAEPNVGVAKVEDPRLSGLEEIFKPKKITPIEIEYVDVPKGLEKGTGFHGELLNHLSRMDALIHVVRFFDDESVPRGEGSVDPEQDITNMNLELVFSDLAIVERRLKRIEESLKGAKASEKDTILREQAALVKVKSALEKELPIWEQGLDLEETRIIQNYQFLTAKPLMIVLNVGEETLHQSSEFEEKFRCDYPRFLIATVCCKLEMELIQLTEIEAQEFRSALGGAEAALPRLLQLSCELLGVISFFTTASKEVRAWAVHRGSSAVKAAGKIHSDMERGFIRAEVISYDELLACGGLAEARKKGTLRLEGKNYVVQDGDVITFLFSV